MSADYLEYIVDEVSGESSSHGNPDKIANMILERWGLIPKGENPADCLFQAAVPPSRFVGAYRLKVLESSGRLQAWLHGQDQVGEVDKLDFGPAEEKDGQTNGTRKFVVEGNYLSKITILCHPVLQSEEHDEERPAASALPVMTNELPPAEPALSAVTTVSSTAELCDIPVGRIRRNRDQPRKRFTASDLLLLGNSMKEDGQTTRIDVIRVTGDPDADFELVRGERRWRAAQLVGIPILRATVLSSSEIPNKDVQHRVCLISDLHHSNYSDVELAFALARQKAATGATLQALATMCKKKSISWVVQHLAITELAPELLKLLDPNLPKAQRLSFTIAWRIAKLPPVEQVQVWSKVSQIKGAKLQMIETEKMVAQQRLGGPRKASPADLYKNLGAMVPRVLGDASIAEGYSGEVFLSFVQHRPADEVSLTMKQIEDAIAHLTTVKDRIGQARTKWNECQQI